MPKRFVAIWFRRLITDWYMRRSPELRDIPFVLAAPEHGHMRVKATSAGAQRKGIEVGMIVADSRAILPDLCVLDAQPGQAEKLLRGLAEVVPALYTLCCDRCPGWIVTGSKRMSAPVERRASISQRHGHEAARLWI